MSGERITERCILVTGAGTRFGWLVGQDVAGLGAGPAADRPNPDPMRSVAPGDGDIP